ncbi:MAG: alpha/beta hydrolase domain-containing protein, partial [Acetobacteraceae bacterium]|nr:alpha/beta hydrolase domain-containing protein [Acetobacteraceae bacterium]
MGRVRWGLLGVVLVLGVAPAEARVTEWHVVRAEPAFGGQAFGAVGSYEWVTARVEGVLDPADPRNAIIQDLALAPKDARGLVHYSTNVELLAPAEAGRGNGVLLFEVANRGNKLILGAFNAGVAGGTEQRNGLTSPGDGWLMRQGYTVVWGAWEMDVRPGWNRILMPEIVAHQPDGSPITGVVRAEMETPAPVDTLSFTRSQQVMAPPADSYDGYPTAKLDNTQPFADGFLPTLTVRAREQDPRVPIPNGAWHFGACQGPPDAKHICLPEGFKPGRLYELIYRAQDPLVQGIGFAATRDLGAFLTHATADDAGTANPLFRPGQRAILEGTSQSGRMVRSFLALGFNEDEQGRRVFDGAFPHIGGGLMPLNVRFGQAYRAWGEQTDHTYPAYEFPFTYGSQSDPLTGRRGGLLDRCEASGTCPLIFHVATVLEMWEGRQSLGLTDPLGRRDVADPAGVRTYIMASTQHGPASPPLPAPGTGNMCQQQSNPNPQTWTMRALLTDLSAWMMAGT